MRNCLVLALLAMLVATPALAGDGNVSKSALNALGLGQMAVQSDAFGMQVRGMSSNAQASSLSAFAIFLFDPNTAATFNHNGNGFARSTAENGGLPAPASTADAGSLTQQTPVNHAIMFNGISFNAVFSAFGINGNMMGPGNTATGM